MNTQHTTIAKSKMGMGRTIAPILAWVALCAGAVPSFANTPKMVQMAPLLTKTATDYLTQVQGLSAGSFTVAPISQSLTLPQCGTDIQVQPRAGQLTTLTMTCTKPIYWKRHISIRLGGQNAPATTAPVLQNLPSLGNTNTQATPAQPVVKQSKPQQPQAEKKWLAVVVTAPLQKGHIIQPEDVTVKPVLSNPGSNTYTTVEQVLNLQIKFNLQHDHILRYTDVQKQAIVRRGDAVTLVSQGSGFRIAMEGVAENDASVGQRIRATNRSSGKTVYGVLQKDKTVLVKEFK